MSIKQKCLYLLDIARKNNIKSPKDVLFALMPFDIIFKDFDNIDLLVEVDEFGRTVQLTPSGFMPIKIKEDYLQVIFRKDFWSGRTMFSSIIWTDDNPHMPDGKVCPMHVKADDGLSISIDDLFVYERDLADLESRKPEIFAHLVNAEEIIEQHGVSPEQQITKLTDHGEIIRNIKNAMRTVTLKPKEGQYIKALLARLEGKPFKDCYLEANPKTQSEEPKTWLDQGKRYCMEAHTTVAKKMGINFDIDIIKGHMDS